MPQCIVNNCKNRTRSRPVLRKRKINKKNINNVSYHRFPKNEKAKKKWLDILELKAELVPIGARICSAHFAEDAFNLLNGTKRLRPNALPYIVVDQSTNTSPKKDHDALEKKYSHKKLQYTKTSFLKELKFLEQKIRQKELRIISLEAILNSLKRINNRLENRMYYEI